MNALLEKLTADGGMLRVRALLALGMTGIGGGFMLANGEMPPGEFNVLWGGSIAYYFGARGSS